MAKKEQTDDVKASTPTPVSKVTLTTAKTKTVSGKESDAKTREFPTEQAIALLSIRKPQWRLPEDSKFVFDGKEIKAKS